LSSPGVFEIDFFRAGGSGTMRISYVAIATIVLGALLVVHENAAAQTAPRSSSSAKPHAMRSALTSQRAPTPSNGAPPTRPDPAGDQADRVVGEIRSMEQGLEQANRLLQQRLAKSEQVRRQGLQKQDQRLLQQAEQMDRQAIAAYEQQLRQFETFSRRIEQTSQTRAEQAAARANGNQAGAGANRNGASRQPANSNDSPSNTFRGLFRFGR
jgi:hypothetical protein